MGELKVQASADLGGLGAQQGPLVSYNWSLSNLLPPLMPWLVLLVLLALKSNRSAQAWLIWVPLLAWVGLCAGLQMLSGDNEGSSFLPPQQLLRTPAFAIAALWLLGSVLAGWAGLMRFVGGTFVVAAIAYLYFLINTDLGEAPFRNTEFYILIALWAIAAGFAIAFGLMIAKLVCWRQYHRFRLTIGLLVGLLFGWSISFGMSIIVAPFFNSSWEASEIIEPTFFTTAVTFLSLLPFLILSFANSFYRQRMQSALHLESAYSPPSSLTSLPVGTVIGQK